MSPLSSINDMAILFGVSVAHFSNLSSKLGACDITHTNCSNETVYLIQEGCYLLTSRRL